jgi:hypothetical protein
MGISQFDSNQHEFGFQKSAVMNSRTGKDGFVNSGAIQATQVVEPPKLAPSLPCAPSPVMGLHQFHSKPDQLLNAIKGTCEKLGFLNFDDSSLLHIVNSMWKTLIDGGIVMGQHPIVPISAQIEKIKPSQVLECDMSFNASIGYDVEGLAPNSTCPNVSEGQTIMGNASVGRIDDQLNPEPIPTHIVNKIPMMPNLGTSASTIVKEHPTMKLAPPTNTSMPIHSANSLRNLTSNFEPSSRANPGTDSGASKLASGHQSSTQQARNTHNRSIPTDSNAPSSSRPPTVIAGATQIPRSYAAALNCKPAITQAERSQKKSFANVLRAPEDSRYRSLVSKEPYIHHGEPAVFFDESDELFLAEAYRFTLVGKFVHRKPFMNKVRENFMRFGFTGDYEIGLIDEAHIIIHLAHEDDYSRLFLKPTWYIDGCPMRVFKWTPNFCPQFEAPIAPVWVSFPLLPIHFRDKSALFAIAKTIGLPLRIDEATSDLRRPSEARVCVEVDLECKLPDRVWIEREKWGGYWQPVVYDKVPDFCFRCRHFGHMDIKCPSSAHSPPPLAPSVVANQNARPPTLAPPMVATQNARPPPALAKDKGKGKEVLIAPRQRWTPIKRTQKQQDGTSSLISHSNSENITAIPPTIPPTTVFTAHTATTSDAPPVIRTIDPHVTFSIPPAQSAVAPIVVGHHDQSIFKSDVQLVAQSSDPISSTHAIGSSIYFDPLPEDMMERPRDSIGFDVPVSPTHCQQNLEASLSTQSDSESFSQIEVHQQGPFRRSSSEDLAGMVDRTEDDGFLPVGRKRTAKVKGTPISRMATRSRSQDTSSHISR